MPAPSDSTHAGGRLAPGLRCASHNVRGLRCGAAHPQGHLRSKVHNLVRIWAVHLRLHVVCLQETKVRADDTLGKTRVEHALLDAAADLGVPPFKVFWGCSPASAGGVAILVRDDLLSSGRLVIVGGEQRGLRKDPDGRLMHLQCSWAGLRFLLASVYLPSGDPAGQSSFISDRLRPLVASSSLPCLIAGDFNFTPSWLFDRLSTAQPVAVHRDEAPAAAMLQLATEQRLVDAYRHLHPSRRSYTFHGPRSAARLDRIYISAPLLPYLHSCSAAPDTTSDHLPVIAHLRPAAHSSVGRGLPRARLDFLKSQDLADSFWGWIRQEATAAPTEDAALLGWWPLFKEQVAGRLSADSRQHRLAAADLRDEHQAARQAFAAALDAAEATPSGAAGIQQVLETRRRYVSALDAAALPAERRAQAVWLRDGERASPLLTALTQRPKATQHIGALRDLGGGLLTDGPSMARRTSSFFAGVSAGRPRDLEAEEQVLAAVRQHACRVDARAADDAGNPKVSADEVRQAIRQSRPGTAPGLDGLPLELWRKGGMPVWTLLAAVFSAIGRSGRTPTGFLDGALCPIFKKGDLTEPVNYRPITLLNVDYRLMAKVLASRTTSLLAPAIGPEQTAFLPGRLIADNINFLHLLPCVLASNATSARQLPSSAVLGFLDFLKAYDTVNRDFLLEVMRVVGVGDGLLKWVSTILTDTRAVAVVNGHVSTPDPWKAGVRQGCPLAPALYLFIGWALGCWLKCCPSVGVEILPGMVVHSMHYADDCTPVLSSLEPSTVHTFLHHMHTFDNASWQRLNLSKCQLLPVGVTEPLRVVPFEVEGLAVVQVASCLGASFSNATTPVAPPLEDALAKVEACYSRVAKLGLSIFGRAQAASTYGVSLLLYHAEHNVLADSVADQIQKWSVGLTDRGEAPRVPGRPARPPTLPGVRSRLLFGKPAEGGFGTLPWREHIMARHAMLGRRFVVWTAADPSALVRTRHQLCHEVALVAPAGTTPRAAAAATTPAQVAASVAAAAAVVAAAATARGALPNGGAAAPPPSTGAAAAPRAGGAAAAPHAGNMDREPPPGGAAAVTEPCPLWVPMAKALLQRRCPHVHPALTLLAASHASPLEAAAGRLPAQLVGGGLMGPALPVGPLSRMAVGLGALGPVADVAASPLQPGAWCALAPLWGNPLLQLELRLDQRTVAWGAPPADEALQRHWGTGFAHMALMPGLHTVGSLVVVFRALNTLARRGRSSPPAAAGSGANLSLLLETLYGSAGAATVRPLIPVAIRLEMEQWSPTDPSASFFTVVWAMYKAIPGSWLSPIFLTMPPVLLPQPFLRPLQVVPDEVDEAVKLIVMRLGWRPRSRLESIKPRPGLPCMPPPASVPDRVMLAASVESAAAMSVKAATTILILPDLRNQSCSRSEYVASALQIPLPTGLGDLAAMAAVRDAQTHLEHQLAFLWGLPWDNVHKEPLWRLTVNGVVGAGGHGICPSGPCPCGWAGPAASLLGVERSLAWQRHHFWSCPVAVAVVAELLASLPPSFELSCADVWLLRAPPQAGLHGGVWALVCMVALAAMHYGRRLLWSLLMENVADVEGEDGFTQTLITDFFPVVSAGDGLAAAPIPLPQRAARKAAAWFWCLLQDFVSLQTLPPSWMLDVPGATHPFIGVDRSARGQLQLRLNVPPGLDLPASLYDG